MPKRNKEQQERHNEARRKLKKAGKKAIFCMQYVETKQPRLLEDATKLYDFLIELYPGKHDLTKTAIYKKCMENQDTINTTLQYAMNNKNKILQPVLNIPLMPLQTPPSSTPNETTHTEEMPPQLPLLTDEETNNLIKDLSLDPDLMSFFEGVQVDEITVATEKSTMETVPKSPASEIQQIIQDEFNAQGADLPDIMKTEKSTIETVPKSPASEIEQIIQDEFNALGADLPDIMENKDDELLW